MVAAPERESGCLESESGFIGTEAGFFGAEAGFVETGSGRSSNNPMKGFTKCESVVSAATSSCPRAAREKPTHEKTAAKGSGKVSLWFVASSSRNGSRLSLVVILVRKLLNIIFIAV